MNTEMICRVEDLGLVDYEDAWACQKVQVDRVRAGGRPVLLLCEHPAVITLGRLAQEKNILVSRETLEHNGVQVVAVDRGGDVTLHAPGQLVVYPILPLAYWKKDLHWYLAQLEQVAIDLLKSFGIVANRISGKTGVWADNLKIASIGIGVRQWVSYHGVGINVDMDMELFDLINPCGLDARMTSMARVKGVTVEMRDVKECLVKCFHRQFNLPMIYAPVQL
ncbi:MAG: lipoyl(octanoyl) transferase LipB [Candidatus Omnitrophica bacterium]|nr:lipoyl(octanoyl) transferase LipB [Candidatus Omnitrophota bacterium]